MSQTDDVKEKERQYMEQTGASRADFFRRKLEVNTGDFDDEDAKP